MKTLTSFLFCCNILTAEGQTTIGPSKDSNYIYDFKGTWTASSSVATNCTYMFIVINPTIVDTTKVYSDVEIFQSMLGWDKFRYESETSNKTCKNVAKCNCIELQISAYGRVNNYTFEEFKKLLYP